MALVAVVLGSINMATLFDTHDEVQAVLKKLGDGTGSLAKEIATDEVNMLQGPAALNIHGSNGDGPPAFPPLDAEPEMYPQGNWWGYQSKSCLVMTTPKDLTSSQKDTLRGLNVPLRSNIKGGNSPGANCENCKVVTTREIANPYLENLDSNGDNMMQYVDIAANIATTSKFSTFAECTRIGTFRAGVTALAGAAVLTDTQVTQYSGGGQYNGVQTANEMGLFVVCYDRQSYKAYWYPNLANNQLIESGNKQRRQSMRSDSPGGPVDPQTNKVEITPYKTPCCINGWPRPWYAWWRPRDQYPSPSENSDQELTNYDNSLADNVLTYSQTTKDQAETAVTIIKAAPTICTRFCQYHDAPFAMVATSHSEGTECWCLNSCPTAEAEQAIGPTNVIKSAGLADYKVYCAAGACDGTAGGAQL